MTMIETMVKAIEPELVGHIDPETHAMSEYGVAVMVIRIALTALLKPTKRMVKAGEIAGWDEANHMPAINMTATAFTAMIQAALDEAPQ